MKLLNCSNLTDRLEQGILTLEEYGFLRTGEDGIVIKAEKKNRVTVEKTEQDITINYDTEPHFYMALARSIGLPCGNNTIEAKVEKLGLMLDCSRNAVAKPEMVKQLICLLVLAGYNYLELYTEDTYELPGEPYFGYKRGRYRAEELKEIIEFAELFGMEVVPCIQTLAHLSNLANWKPYFDHMDIDDILLVGDERTYDLIRKSLRFCRAVFHTNRINIGTDEAFRLGRGKYTDVNGYRSKHEIYLEHLKKVFELCREEGFCPEFWGDAFYRTECGKEEIQKLFDGTQIPIYWNYSSTDADYHSQKLKMLKGYTGRAMYAGGFWKWLGVAPGNRVSMCVLDAAFTAAEENHIDNILMTAWGDNGDECSVYAIMPSLWYAANKLYPCDTDVNCIVETLTGYTVDEWLYSDRLNHVMPELDKLSNAAKYLLYNDFLIGLLDYNIPEHAGKIYEDLLPEFQRLAKKDSSFSYIFKSYAALCQVLIGKATCGKRLYQAYRDKDRDALQALTEELKDIQKDLRSFYDAFRILWMKENKGFGFEVMDVRIGGLISRIDTVVVVLWDYLEGKTDKIYELEEERIEYFCGQLTGDEVYAPVHSLWSTAYTVNHL